MILILYLVSIKITSRNKNISHWIMHNQINSNHNYSQNKKNRNLIFIRKIKLLSRILHSMRRKKSKRNSKEKVYPALLLVDEEDQASIPMMIAGAGKKSV